MMDLNISIHVAEEGGYWAEVANMPGTATQGETITELFTSLGEAIEGAIQAESKK